MTVPYESATSGAAAREEITKLLRRLGCERVGFMDDFEHNEVLLAFVHRGRPIEMRASAKGWAAMYLKAYPWTRARKSTQVSYEAAALKKGLIAVNSVMRDWVKGSVTAIECGMMSVEEVFLAQLRLPDGTRLIDNAQRLLAPGGG